MTANGKERPAASRINQQVTEMQTHSIDPSTLRRRRQAADDTRHRLEWQRQLDTWATLNGFRRTDADFGLGALVPGAGRNAAWGMPYQWSGCDHASYYLFNRKPVAVTTETYSAADLEGLRDLAADHGLDMHSPVDPRASFWAPGLTMLAVITARDFGPVRWLPWQRTRPGTPPAPAIQGYPLAFSGSGQA